MLRKLLKYDLKYMIKNMLVFYILSLVSAVLVRIFGLCPDTAFVNTCYSFSVGFLIAMFFNIFINTIIRSWVLFKSSIYGDEGYLTNTLPVTKKELYESRFIKMLIFSIVGFLVFLGCLFIAFYSTENINLIKGLYTKLITGMSYSKIENILIILSVIVVLFLEFINLIQAGFLGIIIGHKKNDKKVLYSTFIGSIAYFISQVVILVFLLISGLIFPDIFNIFRVNPTNIPLNIISYIAVISYALVIVLINIICVKKLNKGVNLE